MRRQWQVLRRDGVRGLALPVFIHNFDWSLSSLELYADGAINCWGYVDRALFQKKLERGWVQLGACVDRVLSIHNLGQGEVVDGYLGVSHEDLTAWLDVTLNVLNSQMVGLVDMQGSDTELREGVRWAKMPLGPGRLYREEGLFGESLPLLRQNVDGFELVDWLIYEDGRCQIDDEPLCDFETVVERVESGEFCTSVPDGCWLLLDTLGQYRLRNSYWWATVADRVLEARDVLAQLTGGPGVVDICAERFSEFLKRPSSETKARLREAYENVPEQLRMSCGDQDSKDIPIRMVLYGEKEIENWSHYVVSKELGDELPTIEIPTVD